MGSFKLAWKKLTNMHRKKIPCQIYQVEKIVNKLSKYCEQNDEMIDRLAKLSTS